jgi:hypothetical protein
VEYTLSGKTDSKGPDHNRSKGKTSENNTQYIHFSNIPSTYPYSWYIYELIKENFAHTRPKTKAAAAIDIYQNLNTTAEDKMKDKILFRFYSADAKTEIWSTLGRNSNMRLHGWQFTNPTTSYAKGKPFTIHTPDDKCVCMM